MNIRRCIVAEFDTAHDGHQRLALTDPAELMHHSDNALADTEIGLCETELIHHRGPGANVDQSTGHSPPERRRDRERWS